MYHHNFALALWSLYERNAEWCATLSSGSRACYESVAVFLLLATWVVLTAARRLDEKLADPMDAVTLIVGIGLIGSVLVNPHEFYVGLSGIIGIWVGGIIERRWASSRAGKANRKGISK